MGLSLLFTALGLFQYMQVFLASTIYIEISKGIFVSPGSSVLFTGSLFAVLIVYIKEDAIAIRKIIYALLSANIIMSILLYSFSWNVIGTEIYNPLNVSAKLFSTNSWVLFVGTLTLLLDSLLIIFSYEFISKFTKSLFFRIFLSMMIVVSFDAICFSVGSFWNSENLKTILFSGIIAKNSASLFYSFIFYIYLKYIDKEAYSSKQMRFNDLFQTFTYRQKYEIITNEKFQKEKEFIESESKYQTLANISPVGIFQTNVEGKTIYVNPQWCKISGVLENEALDDDWLNAVHPLDRENVMRNWTEAVSKTKVSTAEYRFLHKDASVAWVLGYAIPILDNENEIIGYIGTITDITERKKLEQDILRISIETEEKERKRFARDLHDEIGPMFSTLKLYSTVLAKTDDKQKKENLLLEVNEIVEEAVQLIKNISADLTPELLEHFGVISALKLFTSKISANTDVKIFVETNDENKRISEHQEVNIYRILKELVNNSIKYSKANTIKIQVMFEPQKVSLSFSDNGIGFDFHEYVQKSNSGNGINNIIQRTNSMNGTYKVLSKSQNTGFSIKINLPNID